ncbi:MAG: ECF transporter S component [Firmicutes bacterium]|nr:ECF transporter S component [Bacillota bacterium]
MKKTFPLRAVVLCAMLTAVASALFLIQFTVPLVPSFLKMDVSDLPALVASLAVGPFWGVLVCLLKNVVGLLHSGTMGVGEISNFIISAALTLVAGFVFRKNKSKGGAVLASALGAVAMAAISLPSNLFLIYPLYTKVLGLPIPVILGWYQAVLPSVDSLWEALLIFNVPFTFVKGLLCAALMALVYLPLRPVMEKFLKSK